MFRKKRQPAPFFNMPGAPFNPTTGERAPLGAYPVRGTTLALFQVIEEDTHDNYVVCRGHEADSDQEFRYLHDPYTVPTTTPINVAKPYSVRGTNPYEIGQVIVAARIKGKLGYNPGKAVTVGQPADLDEEISLLNDDDSVGIAWMDITPPQSAVRTPTLAVLTSSLAAANWTLDSPPIDNPAFTTGTGNIYAISSANKYAVIESGATIVNQNPWTYANSDVVKVTYHSGKWVVLGLYSAAAGLDLNATEHFLTGTGNGSGTVTWTETLSEGDIVTVSTINITANANISTAWYKVDWRGTISDSVSATSVDHIFTWVKNGISVSAGASGIFATEFKFTGLDSATHAFITNHSGLFIIQLVAGDILTLTYATVGATVKACAEITPLFGWRP